MRMRFPIRIRSAIGCLHETESVAIFRIESENGLGTLANRVPIEASQRLFSIVKKAVNLALDTLANHEWLHI